MEEIKIKLKSLPKQKGKQTSDGGAIMEFEIEPYTYKGKEYSQIELQFRKNDKVDFKILAEGNKVYFQVQEAIKIEEDKLVLSQPFTYEITTIQKVTDEIKEQAQEIGNESSSMVKKTGAGIKKAGEKLEDASENKWSRWVLPALLIVGVVSLILLLVWFFSNSKKNR